MDTAVAILTVGLVSIAYLFAVGYAAVSIVRSRDVSSLGKLAWLVVLAFMPLLAALVRWSFGPAVLDRAARHLTAARIPQDPQKRRASTAH